MDNWQFLIQRQGDRAWHTLESPKGEIIEGRYRVLARSNRPNIDVEVRVIHSSTQEVPPKRRIQKRSRRTNNEGLMAVIPYTYFKPGIWELQCSGDLMSDILGKSWQYNIYLRVLPQQTDVQVMPSDDSNDVSSDGDDELTTISVVNLLAGNSVESTSVQNSSLSEPRPTITPQTSSQTKTPVEYLEEDVIIDQPVSPVWVRGVTAEQLLQNLIDLALPSGESLLDEELLAEPQIQPALPPLSLNLEQETYVARWGESLTINGRVELQEKTDWAVEIPYLESLYSLEVRISLRSPVKSDILNEVRQSLPNELLPFNIESSINIPADCESKLILAEVSLYGALTNVGEVTLLASQPFTITADVSELLAITAAFTNTSELEELEVAEVPERAAGIDLSLLNLVKAVPSDQSLTLENKFLPPEIKPRSRKKSLDSHRGLELPNMPPLPPIKPVDTAILAESLTAEATTTELATQPESLEKVETLAAINMEQLVIKNRRMSMLATTFPYLKPLMAATDEDEAVQSEVVDTSSLHSPKNSQMQHSALAGTENTTELSIDDQQSQVTSVTEVSVSRRSKLIDAYVAEVTNSPRPELIDDFVTPTATPPSSELIDQSISPTDTPPSSELINRDVPAKATPPNPKLVIEGNPYSSPLITKWLENQGFTLPEPIHLQDQDEDCDVVVSETVSTQPERVSTQPEMSSMYTSTEEIPSDWLAIAQQDLESADNLVKAYSTPSLPVPPPPPPPRYQKIPLPKREEIVVDDIYVEEEPEVEIPETLPVEEEVPEVPLIAERSPLPRMAGPVVELLPTPKLYVPEGELIAGLSVKVRLELQQVSSEVILKLWIEDCQSRWLIDGPHLLKNLQTNSRGRLEVTTQLDIPFGCVEVRIEAIALNPETQQESHKVSLTRAVIPPNLPTLQLDELLGI
ncbi:hypothetical protein H6G33_28935 [Calothrix sp. FACHB-1219]|uniref:hypothetical protein n=1 Tax=unclassified Calothrix TaxID=2619626 RepID=UPI00168798A3|nr:MULTISPECIES: hypothetical protein [unclassified Calothrix]MBD2206160.1 hypothetical protein [Calothrix sp. FACHB-168]MBD2221005.1 hypothetical protein [Calothrix sp. FACHB-1219]